jgi:hypothetical protein
MRPEHDLRRRIIREWMSLPREKRLTPEQAAAFATTVVETSTIGQSSESAYRRVMAWLSPRVGRA